MLDNYMRMTYFLGIEWHNIMTEIRRQVLEFLHGDSLVWLLNEKASSDSSLGVLQMEVKRLLAVISNLTEKLRMTQGWNKDVGREATRILGPVNKFLQASPLSLKFVVAMGEQGNSPQLFCDYLVSESDADTNRVVLDIGSLGRYGLLDRVRQCQRTSEVEGGICGKWFFAKKSDAKYCSRDCQLKPTDERKRRKREYARRHYWNQKARERRALNRKRRS